MIYYLIAVLVCFAAYFFYLNPAFIHPKFTWHFIQKKLLFAILLGIYLPFSSPANEKPFLNAISLSAVFIYTAYRLALDCPKGYAESALPFLKAVFLLISFFTCISFKKDDIFPTISSIVALLLICFASVFFGRKSFFQSKSAYIEIVLLCIEHAVALVTTALLTEDNLTRILIMALTEEIILIMIHLILMFFVQLILKEDTAEYFTQKRNEMLFH